MRCCCPAAAGGGRAGVWPGAASGQGQPTWWHGAVGRVCLPSQHHGPAPRCHLQHRLQAEKGEGCSCAHCTSGGTGKAAVAGTPTCLPPPWELQDVPCPRNSQASYSSLPRGGVWGDASRPTARGTWEHWDLGILEVTDMRAVVSSLMGSQSLGILCSVSAQTPMLGKAW